MKIESFSFGNKGKFKVGDLVGWSELRKKYVAKMHEILAENGRIAGLMFNAPLNGDKPPFGGNTDEYRNLFQDKFEIKTIEIAHNSIESRAGREVFINFIKK